MGTPADKRELLATYEEAYRYHSAKSPENRSDEENKWLAWVPGRIAELKEELKS